MSVIELDQGPLYWKNRILAAWAVEAEYQDQQRRARERDQWTRENAARLRGR